MSLPEVKESLPWTEKYRPAELKDIVSHQAILGALRQLIEANKMPHLLLVGPPGTGKTSTILACARQLYGASVRDMVMEINAADERGIDVVRDQIKSFVSSRALFRSAFKLVILDEADALTRDAQAALRRIIEVHTPNARFCLVCNYADKLIPALHSRCTRFRFAHLSAADMKPRLQQVARAEGVQLEPDEDQPLTAIADLCEGDMRRALHLLQSCHAAFARVDPAHVYRCAGRLPPSEMDDVLRQLLTSPLTQSVDALGQLREQRGVCASEMVEQLHAAVLRDPKRAASLSLLATLADIEFHLASGANPQLQLGALAAAFYLAGSESSDSSSLSGSEQKASV